MPRISTYITDSNINPEDRLLGSDDASGNKPTRQYRIGDLIDFIASGTNTDGLGYRYSQSKDKNTSGYFSTDNTAIRSVTEIYLNNITKEGIDATQLFKVMKDDVTPTYFKIADSKDPSKIAYFNINAIDIQAKNAYVKFSVTLMNTLGYGSFADEKDYYFVLDVVTQADVPTKTSQLENDGEDGLNQFISFADLYTNNAVINYGYYNIPGTYQYFVWSDRYIINGVTYSNYISDTITLDASDPDFDRIDLIVLNSDETISNITGIASSNPVRPEIDESTQVVVTFVIVGQASTFPDDVENTLVYNENAQQVGGEADTTKNSANIDLENTAQAYSGTKSVRFLNSSNGDYANFELEDSFYRNDINFLVFFIKLINTVNHNIQISFVKTGISISISSGSQSLTLTNGKYGFERSNVTDWQAIAIPIVDFNLTASSYKNIRIKNQRNGASFYIDNIFLQKGTSIPDPQRVEKTSDIPLNDGEDGTSRYTEEIDFKTVGGVSIIGEGDIPVGGEIYNPCGTIALMLADQVSQTNQQVVEVTDASADPNITFPVGETKLQAFYRFDGAATGRIDDYTLISAPYGNHSVNSQITKSANYTLDPTENDATIISEGKICTIDPITKTYPPAFTVAMKNDGAATNLVIVPKTGWSYQLNDADAVSLTTGGSNVTLTWTKGGTCTVILKGSTNKILIDGGVE